MPRCPAWCGTWSSRWCVVAESDASRAVDARDGAERADAEPARALIALGANLGDPHATLVAAAEALAGLGEVTARSRLYRTAPVGGPEGQPDYLNAVVELRPAPAYRDPRALLAALHGIEARFGRRRRVRWEARRLDLDLLALGDEVRDEPGLRLPHPRMMERAFVLIPLVDVAPAWRDPRDGRAAAEAVATLPAGGVRPSGLAWRAR